MGVKIWHKVKEVKTQSGRGVIASKGVETKEELKST